MEEIREMLREMRAQAFRLRIGLEEVTKGLELMLNELYLIETEVSEAVTNAEYDDD